MTSGTAIQIFALSGFTFCGRASRSLRILLPTLALSGATLACGQAPVNLPGGVTPPDLLAGVAMKLPTDSAPPSNLVRRQFAQRAQAARNSMAVASPAQSALPAVATSQYVFVSINIPNAPFVQPNSINRAGLAVGYYYDANYSVHGFLWKDGTVQTIDYPGGISTAFGGINDQGVMIGTFQDASYNVYTATYSLANAVWTVLPEIPGGWQEVFGAAGINNEGVAVGCASSFAGLLSWTWDPGSQSYSYFTAPAATEAGTCGGAIGNRGSVAGFLTLPYISPQFEFPFLREDAGEYQTITLPSGLSGGFFSPFGINSSDTIVGTFFTPNFASVSGFIRSRSGVFTIVNQPGADQTYVTGINDLGVLVGDTYSTVTGASPGFVAYPQK